MIKKIFILPIFISLLLVLMVGCQQSEPNNAQTRNLGGVYSSDEADVDFSMEVSGRLSEDLQGTLTVDEANEVLQVLADGSYSNKLLRWGISRRPNNQLPQADPGTPQLLQKYGGIYVGDTSKKEIYLTFDEGYENGYTARILDILKENNAKGVFFITGPYLKEHEDLVRRMVEEGHIVGNHTIHHPSLPSVGDQELEEEIIGLDRAFQEKFGKSMKYLRPPKGEYSDRTLSITQKLGYRSMFWSFAYDDWYRDKIRGPEYAYDIVMRNLHNGAVILLHAVSKDNTDALDSIIKGAKEKGYSIGNVDDIP